MFFISLFLYKKIQSRTEAEMNMVYTILLLLGILQSITGFIDTSNYKILIDRKEDILLFGMHNAKVS